ncbi:MAG: nucleotide exchange factor GrpE [Gemmataceae bacterium]
MNDDLKTLGADAAEPITQGTSSIFRLFEAFIGLREKNERQHKLFEQTLNRTRDALQASFNTFAADTQKAYQQLRQDILGEKKFSLNLLNELLDLAVELDHIVVSRPGVTWTGPEAEPVERWMEAIAIQNRRVQDALAKFGVHPYDAVVGSPYNPSLHERVGTRHVEGMDALRVAEQKERGYSSQQPEFILRRPKVIVTE